MKIEGTLDEPGTSGASVLTESGPRRLHIRGNQGWSAFTVFPASLDDLPYLRAMRTPKSVPGRRSSYDGSRYQMRIEADVPFTRVPAGPEGQNIRWAGKLTREVEHVSFVFWDVQLGGIRRDADKVYTYDNLINDTTVESIGNNNERFRITGSFAFDERTFSLYSTRFTSANTIHTERRGDSVRVEGTLAPDASIQFAVFDPMLYFARKGDQIVAEGFPGGSGIIVQSMRVISSEPFVKRLAQTGDRGPIGLMPKVIERERKVAGKVQQITRDKSSLPTLVRVVTTQGENIGLNVEYANGLERVARNVVVVVDGTASDLGDFLNRKDYAIRFTSTAAIGERGGNGEDLGRPLMFGEQPIQGVYMVRDVNQVVLLQSALAEMRDVGNNEYEITGGLVGVSNHFFAVDTRLEQSSVVRRVLVKGTLAQGAAFTAYLPFPWFMREGDEVSANVVDVVQGEAKLRTIMKSMTVQAANGFGERKLRPIGRR